MLTIKINDNIDNKVHVGLESFVCILNVQFSFNTNQVPSCSHGYVVVNFLFQLIFIFPLFLGIVMYANEFITKEKQKLTAIDTSLWYKCGKIQLMV